MIGGGLDEWLSRLPDAAGGTAEVVRLSDGMTLLAEAEDDELAARAIGEVDAEPIAWTHLGQVAEDAVDAVEGDVGCQHR